MSRSQNEQVLTLTDVKILKFLLDKKKPVKIGAINEFLGKYHQRTKDRVKKLEGLFIQETKEEHSKREKPYEIIPSEYGFVELIVKKLGKETK